jgi:hypothetical protein
MVLSSFDGKERRAYVRLESSLPVKFKIYTEQKDRMFIATTKNISRVDSVWKSTRISPNCWRIYPLQSLKSALILIF